MPLYGDRLDQAAVNPPCTVQRVCDLPPAGEVQTDRFSLADFKPPYGQTTRGRRATGDRGKK